MTILLLKLRGRPVLLGKTIDTAVQDYILKLRENGRSVNTLVTTAKGLWNLADYPRMKGLQLYLYCGQSPFWRRWTFKKRIGSTKTGMVPDDLEVARRHSFQKHWKLLPEQYS